MDGIPPAAKTDAEDVVWALQTADALWRRHERVDAIVWLRRAAQAAAESQNDDRALALARYAAELSEWIARNPPPAGRPEGTEELIAEDVEAVRFDEEVVTNARASSARTLAAISGEVLVPAELRAATVSQERERLELPKRVGTPSSSSQRKASPPPLPPRRPPPPPAPPEMRAPQSTINIDEEELLPSGNLELLSDDEDEESAESAPTQEATRPLAPRAPVDLYPLYPAEPPPPSRRAGAASSVPPAVDPEPDLPTDGAVFDSVTQKIKADLRALEASARRSVSDDDAPPSAAPAAPAPPLPLASPLSPAPPVASLPPAASRPSGPELAMIEAHAAALDLSALEAFADLPDDAREAFAAAAEVHDLHMDEETAGFALAVVLDGEVDVCATIVDAAGERLASGAVLRARGSVGPGAPLRFVCISDQAKVATWDADAVAEAFRTCPWVEEDLCAAANRTHAVVGATMGPLGERLDAALRKQITDRLDVRPLEPGDVLVEQGQPVPGVVLVGAGYLEIVRDGAIVERVSSGQFLFANSILGGGAAPATARASPEGTLVLFADRMVAHELLLTCPPLLEVLAGM